MTLKPTIAAYLDDSDRETGGWVTGTIALLTLASAAIFVLNTYDLAPRWQQFIKGADWAILTLFTVEYGLRVWTAERWWRYVFSFYGVIDLIAIVPFGPGLVAWRGVRLLQWLRVLRLARLFSDRAILARATAADTLAVVRIVSTIVGIIFVYAGLIFQVEEYYQPETFTSFLDAAYFAVVTITTVGYGDITPVSDAGRLCTMLMILTGIALIPTQLGDLIRRILKVSNSVQIPCHRCGWSIHDPDALFCKHCGTSLMITPLSKQITESDRGTVAWGRKSSQPPDTEPSTLPLPSPSTAPSESPSNLS